MELTTHSGVAAPGNADVLSFGIGVRNPIIVRTAQLLNSAAELVRWLADE